ncbi:MAG: DUF2634 domain-containing protein [Clostridiales bacterium]|nr:DUF2634 domain-containing protein [Clostridiales bacterium]
MADGAHKAPVFDFEKGEFATVNGHVKTAVGAEGIKVWIEKILHTELNLYEIYKGTGYGTNLEGHLIGHVYPADYIKAEIGQSIKTALLKHDSITDVRIDNIEIDGSKLTWNITVYTEYGTVAVGGES